MEQTILLMFLFSSLAVTLLSYIQDNKISLRLMSALMLIASSALILQSTLYVGFDSTGYAGHTLEAGDPGTAGIEELSLLIGFWGVTQVLQTVNLLIKLIQDIFGKKTTRGYM